MTLEPPDPYFPIVPVATLDAANLPKTARDEPHLLTAVLVIASRGQLTHSIRLYRVHLTLTAPRSDR